MTDSSTMQLWGGVECSFNRVGDGYYDQVQTSGHDTRPGDLDLFAGLGVRALRYPILWERTAPHGLENADWAWADERLSRLRELNIQPIACLVHHGSGPRGTSLLDESFATGLADYAREVATRFPWIEYYTPVNEPLTTARFSGLYGIWHPHKTDGLSFARILLNQCRATVLAMRAIREINPDAKLIQTEDVGKTHSTATMAYQADFDNERRWLTLDLLCGRVDSAHSMYEYLRWQGITEIELAWFEENTCPPDIVGVDYYVTSERFLDEKISKYPQKMHGGNGQHLYADVDAVRVCAEGIDGIEVLLHEVWNRYGLPIAVTEAHLACTREEQLRWLLEMWNGAQNAKQGGVDVRAVTVWALLGAYDWHCLLTRCEGHYESGVFDLRSPQPRATALAALLPKLATGEMFSHPAIEGIGWWRSPKRLLYPAMKRHSRRKIAPVATRGSVVKRTLAVTRSSAVLIIGADSKLGNAFKRSCVLRGLFYKAISQRQWDATRPGEIEAFLAEMQPWAVVNAADIPNDEAPKNNSTRAVALAKSCARRDIQLLAFSTVRVFDGGKKGAYTESDVPNAIDAFGLAKRATEQRILDVCARALVVRGGACFEPWDADNFVWRVLNNLSRGQRFAASCDEMVAPAYTPDLVHAALDLLIDGECGIWHLANIGAATWFDFAHHIASAAGLDTSLIDAPGFRSAVRHPRNYVLQSERGVLLPSIDSALSCYFNDSDNSWKQAEPTIVLDEPAQRSRLVAA